MQNPIPFRFMGRTPDDDPLHQVIPFGLLETGPAPKCVNVPNIGCVPQYADTVYGNQDGFDPPNDCNGYFTMRRFQVHNNCYNYALDIASNSMALPGRKHGFRIAHDYNEHDVIQGALLDGLKKVGGPEIDLQEALERASDRDDVTLVALLIAPPDPSIYFPGDFHWVRCDHLEFSQWSQKPGPDQVSKLDFRGVPITDPTDACWSLNSGPFNLPGKPGTGDKDFLTAYTFRAWMFVPDRGIDVI